MKNYDARKPARRPAHAAARRRWRLKGVRAHRALVEDRLHLVQARLGGRNCWVHLCSLARRVALLDERVNLRQPRRVASLRLLLLGNLRQQGAVGLGQRAHALHRTLRTRLCLGGGLHLLRHGAAGGRGGHCASWHRRPAVAAARPQRAVGAGLARGCSPDAVLSADDPEWVKLLFFRFIETGILCHHGICPAGGRAVRGGLSSVSATEQRRARSARARARGGGRRTYIRHGRMYE